LVVSIGCLSSGPTAKGVIGALLTGGLLDLVQQFRGAGKADAVEEKRPRTRAGTLYGA
jgi:hypothetical protein